jgi:hypothetical protein
VPSRVSCAAPCAKSTSQRRDAALHGNGASERALAFGQCGSGGRFETLDLGQAGPRIARVPEDKPPVTCLYCGKTIGPSESAVIVTKTSLDESGEPDFTSHSVEGIAHPECWERERPEGREA